MCLEMFDKQSQKKMSAEQIAAMISRNGEDKIPEETRETSITPSTGFGES